MTTAPTTGYVTETLGLGDHQLTLDGNQKVTAHPGTFDSPNANCFSLMAVADCPYATKTCMGSCYIANLKKHRPDIYGAYEINSAMIRQILRDEFTSRLWAEHLGKHIRENCVGGFRWHVSGDVFSQAYADWIVLVCDSSPNVQHWIYTRSTFAVDTLCQAKNLSVNLSADKDNYNQMFHVRRMQSTQGRDLRICYMTLDGFVPDDLPDGSIIFPDYSLRGDTEWMISLPGRMKKMVCPVDFIGKSSHIRCEVCKKCLKPTRTQ